MVDRDQLIGAELAEINGLRCAAEPGGLQLPLLGGGQLGAATEAVDRGALDALLALGIPLVDGVTVCLDVVAE
ncbi:hypothetical protein [Flexivirga alba]|uniref:Uncharacterized protein n=1 Tax=Flexivirga alba TaxID=702742 RepID=A0ABW2ABT8_9MICO